MNSDEWQERRKQAAWRRRRIIYNNDGKDAFGNRLLDGAQQPKDLVRAVTDGEPEDIARLATPAARWLNYRPRAKPAPRPRPMRCG